tara:strand:+ start:956 stop:1324 length:369 start_codon:yes stop_codon:yes gene_type:complete
MQSLNLVHQLLDDTYNPPSKSGTYSLKHSMHGNRVILKYSTIVHFASEKSLAPQVEVARDQARQLMKERVGKLKKEFKQKTDSPLKYDDIGEQDNVELIQSTSNSPRKVAYYRYTQTLDIKD